MTYRLAVRIQASATAAWAAATFDKVVTHSQFTRALLSDAAAAPALTKRIAAVSFPLSSLLAVLPPPSVLSTYAGDESTPDEPTACGTRGGEAAGCGEASSSGEARQLKTELVRLLFTLLRVHVQGASAGEPTDSGEEEGMKGLQTGDGGNVAGGGRWRPDETGRLMAVLLAAYGATCSAVDRATLALLRALDERKAAAGAGLDSLRRLWGAAAVSCVLSTTGGAGMCDAAAPLPSSRRCFPLSEYAARSEGSRLPKVF